MAPSSCTSVEIDPFSSSVEMIDLTQDLTVNTTQDTGMLNRQQGKRPKDNAPPSGGLQGAHEEGLVSLPAASFETTQERGLVISPAARKMILQMALGQSVSTFTFKDGYILIFHCISCELRMMQNRCKNI